MELFLRPHLWCLVKEKRRVVVERARGCWAGRDGDTDADSGWQPYDYTVWSMHGIVFVWKELNLRA